MSNRVARALGWCGLCLTGTLAAQDAPAEPAVGVTAPLLPQATVDGSALYPDAACSQTAGLVTDQILALASNVSTSIGAPGSGQVRGAVALPDHGPGFAHNPRRPSEARYGTVEMVQALLRAAAVVEQELPGSGLVINDLGLVEGGPIAQHGSHQAGRDVDILFYALDLRGEPLPAVGVPLEPNGRGWDFKDLSDPRDDVRVRLDLRRTWRFVSALLEVAGDDVQRIFMAEHLRSLLLEEALRRKAPRRLVQRFEEITCQPGTPHDDHMHVRFHCTTEDLAQGCVDGVPVYPWRRQALKQLGLQPVVARPGQDADSRQAVAARTTTPGQARARAGVMHRKVREFLERRKAWLEAPHPGRPFCR
jgi:penicillin-insensitive murein endopeptidase